MRISRRSRADGRALSLSIRIPQSEMDQISD
jgi:hypothetical protein